MSVPRRTILSWAFYDWANSAFSTTVIAGFFPIFFKSYWGSGLPATESTRWLGYSLSVSALLVALIGPFLGAMADQAGTKKRSLVIFTALGTASTAGLAFVGEGNWQLAAMLYVLATIGFLCSIIFYDSLLVGITDEKSVDVVSARGYALGYLGGGILFAVNAFAASSPETFGLSGKVEAVKLAFLTVAVWWAVFAVPVFLFVREPPVPDGGARGRSWLRAAFAQPFETFRHIRAVRPAFLFLIAYWLYIDGVDTVVRMAVDYGLSLGFAADGLMTALLVTQLVGFPAALVFGRLGERHGPKFGIGLAILVYLLTIAWASQMRSEAEFYVLAVVIGLVQGGIQSLSRSLFARLNQKASLALDFKGSPAAAKISPGWPLSSTWLTSTGRAGLSM